MCASRSWLAVLIVCLSQKEAQTCALVSSPGTTKSHTTSLQFELSDVQNLTHEAILHRASERGWRALEKLGEACSKRIPYDFQGRNPDSKTFTHSSIQKVPKLFNDATIRDIVGKVHEMECHGWLSTNPDSVDGLPSLHLNIISGGKSIVSDKNTEFDEFEHDLLDLQKLIEPVIQYDLLPRVKVLLEDDDMYVQDVFIRRYHRERLGISAHFDVYARATCVCALDNTAADGRNGLYTCREPSNHASLRRYFSLAQGDAVIHTWDVLHGVNIDPELDRTSLIVWFGDRKAEQSVVPWLQASKKDGIKQFVLASALESAEMEGVDLKAGKHATHEILSPTTQSSTEILCDLYFNSAIQGNSFALNRLGGLCEQGLLLLGDEKRAHQILDSFQPTGDLPDAVRRGHTLMSILAKRFWYEGALRGNPLSQRALADEIMFEAFESQDADGRLLAAVLFALAAQQGSEPALDSLSRVMDHEVSANGITTEEAFAASPVVQVAKSALKYLNSK